MGTRESAVTAGVKEQQKYGRWEMQQLGLLTVVGGREPSAEAVIYGSCCVGKRTSGMQLVVVPIGQIQTELYVGDVCKELRSSQRIAVSTGRNSLPRNASQSVLASANPSWWSCSA